MSVQSICEMEFPVFPPGTELPPPELTPDEFLAWLEEARALMPREPFEAWLADPASLPSGRMFEWK